MKEHKRRWTAETKLSLIKEVQTSGSVVETCKKFGVDPNSTTSGKELMILEILRFLKETHHDPEIKRLQAENEK